MNSHNAPTKTSHNTPPSLPNAPLPAIGLVSELISHHVHNHYRSLFVVFVLFIQTPHVTIVYPAGTVLGLPYVSEMDNTCQNLICSPSPPPSLFRLVRAGRQILPGPRIINI